MTLSLHNTLTRRKEAFQPLDPDRVRMYVCGPTVYSFAHIGNARPVVVFDVLYRLLCHHYGAVIYARNITDIDDKIIAAAAENGETIADLTARTEAAFQADMDALGALRPTIQPRATEHIPQMTAMIENLIAIGNAYEADGHVLFNVPSMDDYGRLSGRNRDEQIDGARVEVAPYKRDPADFVLWKPSTDAQPGWDSPWGRGRPGWHIECSAMAEFHLGETFDIHGGGQDLIFPHHENEIAQSTCAHGGRPFARYWVHNGYLKVDHEKMSKSLGNVLTVRELLRDATGEAIRMALLSTHYRQPLDFTLDALHQAHAVLDRIYGALRAVADIEVAGDAIPDEVLAALDDDLNTPLAISHLHGCVSALNKAADDGEKARLKGALLAAGNLLGLAGQDPEAWFTAGAADVDGAEIDALIARRNAARGDRDFAAADRIRDDLATRGIVLEDGAGGTSWRWEGKPA